MPVRFLDSNVFLRYFTRDDPDKAQRCYELFQRVQSGAEQVTTSESVIAEVVYVLSSPRLYAVPRTDIQALLLSILTLRGMRLPNRRLYVRALDVYAEHNIDFKDALTVAHVERKRLDAILSYDRDFDQVASVRREEP